jgi:molecular chaperone GrpE
MTNGDRIPESAFGGSEDADEVDAPTDIGDVDGGAADDASTAPEVVEVDVEERSPLAIAVAQRDDYLEALRRLQAEVDNYRKRVIRQQTEHLDHATEALLERLLPVLDAFDLAIAHAGSAGSEDSGDLTAAFVRIEALLRDILAKEGLDRIDTAGVAFDPTVHDAVAHVPREEMGPGDAGLHGPVVDDVLRAGYRLKGRVLRPAMVRVRG